MKRRYIILMCIFLCTPIYLFSQDFTERLKAVSPDRSENNHFGDPIDIFGNVAVVGNFHEYRNPQGEDSIFVAGAVYIFERDLYGEWQFMQKIVPADRDTGDYFGGSVDVWHHTLVVGAPREKDDASGANRMTEAGSAYVFQKRPDGTWGEVQKLVASDRDTSDFFGSSVAVWKNCIVVGAPHDEKDATGSNELDNAGSAYVFEKNESGEWVETAKLIPSVRGPWFEFGSSLSIDRYIAVGSYGEDEGPLNSAGAVYVFEKDPGGEWGEAARLQSDVVEDYEFFGFRVDISGDFLVAGIPHDHKDETESDSVYRAGSAAVFERDGGGNWNFQRKLVAPGREYRDQFGMDVSISGSRILVGAMGEDKDEGGQDSLDWAGALYCFGYDGEGSWDLEQKLVTSDREQDDYIGENLSLHGEYLLVGADWEDDDEDGENELNNAGSIYFFEACIPIDGFDPDNILVNPGFGLCSLAPWVIFNDLTLDPPASSTLIDGVCGIYPQDLSSAPAPGDIRLDQEFTGEQEARIEVGSYYELSFDAWSAEKARPLSVYFGSATTPFTDLLEYSVELDTIPANYSKTFLVDSEQDPLRLSFLLGQDPNPVWIDNVWLVLTEGDGLKEEPGEGFRAYPNPARDILYVVAEAGSALELYNSFGQLIHRTEQEAGTTSMDLSGFPKGIYFLKAESGSESLIIKIIRS